MFGSRKYSPLPSTNQPQQKRRGPPSPWKKYGIAIAAGILVVLFLAGGRASKQYITGSGSDDGLGEYEYDPTADPVNQDLADYASPPFNPHADEMTKPSHDDEVDEDEEGALHILPFPAASTGEASTALPDFTEIDKQEQDDYTSGTGNNGNEAEETPEEQPKTGPTSFETDPDPSSTTYCTAPHNPDSPIIQYALTIDAGSTGSRIHVYKFNNCGPSPSLEYETFKAIQPGLSSFARDPTAAAASLDPLMEEAVRVVPKELQGCSPVEVKATAGLRLLPGKEGEAILEEVRGRLETDWPFNLGKEESAVEIMDGKNEGVYAWITANYLLNKIGPGATSSDTIAVMDLGGASTQIVFEPSFGSPTETLADGDHKYALTFGGKDFVLYQHSYLGYGLMRARRSVHNLVAFTWSFLQPSNLFDVDWDMLDEFVEIPNPCLGKGMKRRVELDPPGRKTVNVTMTGSEAGFEACKRVVELVMAKDAICEVKPCSFNGVYQPSLLDTFPNGQLLALSYFTDRIQPLLAPYVKSKKSQSRTLPIATLAAMAKDVCAGPSVWSRRWRGDAKALEELEGRPEYCLDLTFMHALLGLGYELHEDRELVVEKKLRGVELGWALGAGIAMLEKTTLTCTA